jgi:hypothetical protein
MLTRSKLMAIAIRRGILFIIAATLLGGCNSRVRVEDSPQRANGENTVFRARQIVDEYLRRDAAPARKSRIRFTVSENGEPDNVIVIDNWRRQTAEETTTLTQIVTPSEDAGLGTLTFEAKGKRTVVVTYAASREEYSETDTGKMFFGGLTAGELLGEWDKFDLNYIGEKDLGGVKVFDVEGKLKAGQDSVVSRLDALFRQDNYVPAELHLFGPDGREIRTYKTTAVAGDPSRPYASRMEVENNIRKSHIVIEVLSREYPATIDDSMFNREKLKRPVRK